MGSIHSCDIFFVFFRVTRKYFSPTDALSTFRLDKHSWFFDRVCVCLEYPMACEVRFFPSYANEFSRRLIEQSKQFVPCGRMSCPNAAICNRLHSNGPRESPAQPYIFVLDGTHCMPRLVLLSFRLSGIKIRQAPHTDLASGSQRKTRRKKKRRACAGSGQKGGGTLGGTLLSDVMASAMAVQDR